MLHPMEFHFHGTLGPAPRTYPQVAPAVRFPEATAGAFSRPDITPWDQPKRIRKRVCVSESGCWLWTGQRTSKGYGVVWMPPATSTTAHRAVYEAAVGAIPDGLQLDHLCRTPSCVHPMHLEPVTALVNVQRAWADRRIA